MVFLRVFLLLYAGDTISLTESVHELQAALHGLHHYCAAWKLEISTEKTKIILFSKGKIISIPNFVYSGSAIEVVFNFRYLGTDLSYNGEIQPM